MTSDNFREYMQNISLPVTPARANNNSINDSIPHKNLLMSQEHQSETLWWTDEYVKLC